MSKYLAFFITSYSYWVFNSKTMYWTYVLYSETLDKCYIGYTADLEKRLHRHNAGRERFTKKGRPLILKYSIAFQSKKNAIQLENRLKKMKNPTAVDLYFKNLSVD